MGRAASFSTCVLDSPPQDSCTFSSSGCQPDYGLCSRQVNKGLDGGCGAWEQGEASGAPCLSADGQAAEMGDAVKCLTNVAPIFLACRCR